MEIDEEERNALVNVNFFAQNVNILSNVNVSGTPERSAFFCPFWAEYY
ncbi:hypothetical protein ACQUEN_10285 [Lactococcus taiwanensis]